MFADTEVGPGSFEHCWRRWLRGVGLVALAAGLLAALPATAAAVPGGATVFVQSAKSGQLRGGRLVLGGVSGRVSWATNSGRAGVISLRRLHRRLIRPGKPATGTLHIAGQRGGQELAFRLSRPRYNPARHTVAYRATPLRGRRAARAAAFRRPRRFGPASLSIIPHPTLMGTIDSPNCTATITNNTNYDLNARGGQFEQLVTDQWNPMWPQTIAAHDSATWASVGKDLIGCVNEGIFSRPAPGSMSSSWSASQVRIPSATTARPSPARSPWRSVAARRPCRSPARSHRNPAAASPGRLDRDRCSSPAGHALAADRVVRGRPLASRSAHEQPRPPLGRRRTSAILSPRPDGRIGRPPASRWPARARSPPRPRQPPQRE